MAGELENNVAIITGAGSGIGKAAALLFADEGAAVACADVNGRAAEELALSITEAGGRALPLEMDVSIPLDCERMASETLAAFGSIDVLYANAGIAGVGDAMNLDVELWNRVIAVNLTGVWLSCKYVLPHMVSQGKGAIINQASIVGLLGFAGVAPYAAAKGGVMGLTRQMAVDFGPKGIRVNAICPGTVATPLVTDTYNERARLGIVTENTSVEEGLEQAVERYPIGRLGTVEDVANLALFLASDRATWITGGIYTVDGGYTAV
jgi:NAD(P)-dependent dehydrogenase (short-subunit alcohol dehydrogenase family)